ncbi:LLM class oxidoreductase [Marinivivus vitaminiproducens]|uniref:LLM class oxidoreductase n=1 Tax=Marinivivus vitaminiproducens TaxID=3035935 RepID=UPI0027A768DA|nr:LLM class oxidoreductase [Geminicoccaceae bacterium SCSIO 64248]
MATDNPPANDGTTTGGAPAGLRRHRSFDRLFRPGALTFGFILPLEAYAETDMPTMSDHAEMARMADQAGFAALWLRDVPLRDPGFGDTGQIFDPFVYAGWLAGQTQRIAIGTAGIVLPLRDPLIVAKQASTVDQLAGGRLILGLSTGDRPVEYPAFGLEFANRAERFRDAVDIVRTTTRDAFPRHVSDHYGRLDGSLDLVPKPAAERLPLVAVGRCGQTMEWLAANLDGWLWHQSDFRGLADITREWRDAVGPDRYKPYGYGHWLDLLEDPDAPLQVGRGVRTGRKALIDLWKRQRDEGVSHIAINLRISQRPARQVLDELGEHVLPVFPAADTTSPAHDRRPRLPVA